MSDQPSLDFQPHRLHRRTDPDTSVAAAERARALVEGHEAQILNALRWGYVPEYGLTSEQIGDRTELGQVPVARRLRAMAERNLVIATEQRRANRSGRAAIVWKAVRS